MHTEHNNNPLAGILGLVVRVVGSDDAAWFCQEMPTGYLEELVATMGQCLRSGVQVKHFPIQDNGDWVIPAATVAQFLADITAEVERRTGPKQARP